MHVTDLPGINAALNASAAVLLILGFTAIRKERVELHRTLMLSAFAMSCLFLASYLIYHSQVGSVRFERTGAIRSVYLTILLTHTVLAAALPMLAIFTLKHALQGRFDRHRRLAKWALPIWLYVSVTGVVVYWMLYRM
jgi:uncharacterized membrane protein YozB (DUF420 family)